MDFDGGQSLPDETCRLHTQPGYKDLQLLMQEMIVF